MKSLLKQRVHISSFTWMILAFSLVYGLISFVNHYCFRTYGLDLGLYTNAMYDYVHGSMANMDMIWDTNELALADHFDLYLIFFSPLVLVFGSTTLLIIQIAAIVLGAKGIHTYFKEDPKIAMLATFFFLSFFGVISSVSFDYHSNVIGAMAVPWLCYFVREKRFLASSFLLIFIWIGKENMPFWLAFVCLGLVLMYRKDRRSALILSGFALASFFYFILVIKWIMPSLSVGGEYVHFAYGSLGESMGAAFVHLFTHPVDSIELLFTNHLPDPRFDGVKLEAHIILLLSGVLILFRKPAFLIMLAPIYFQKFFHDQAMTWSAGGQYSIEFTPILAIGVFTIIRDVQRPKLKTYLSITAVVLSLGCTIRVMDKPFLYVEEINAQFYKREHYSRDYSTKSVYEALQLIPEDKAVSAQNMYIPHLALRTNIFLFPAIKTADYILVSTKEYPYPLEPDELEERIEAMKKDTLWTVLYDKKGVYLFEKK